MFALVTASLSALSDWSTHGELSNEAARALPAIDDNLIAAINADKTSKYVAGKNIRFEGATLLDAKRLMGTLQAPATEFLPARSIEEALTLSLIHISEPTRQEAISYAVFCLKKKKK